MPAPRETIEVAVAQVAAYCEQRATDDYRIEHAVRGSSITIVERRPPPAPDVAPLLVAIEEDRAGIFWG